eukprot:6457648-Amphidinium_carterae.1
MSAASIMGCQYCDITGNSSDGKKVRRSSTTREHEPAPAVCRKRADTVPLMQPLAKTFCR